MATGVDISEKLLAEVQKLSGKKSRNSAVNSVLREFVQRRRRQLKALELCGKFEWDPDYDYKRERRRKRGGTDA